MTKDHALAFLNCNISMSTVWLHQLRIVPPSAATDGMGDSALSVAFVHHFSLLLDY